MTILALDLGTKCGWAVRRPSGIFSGTESFKPSRFEGGGMQWMRFDRWLGEVCYANDVRQIIFEEVRRHAGTTAAHVYGGYVATLTKYCEATLVPYGTLPVGTIKKFMTGKGNASKDEMIAAVKARGFAPTDDNEADAIAILLCAEAQERDAA